MKSVCFFASYFKGTEIPYYITVYLTELKKHFDEVVLLASNNTLSDNSTAFLSKNNISVQLENNEGYDFGLWYKAFQKYNFDQVYKIALVNDSCILFKPLDQFMKWAQSDTSDMQSITYSEAVSKHLQSYFLIINKKAIPFVCDFFNKNKVLDSIHEVIYNYEIGLSKALLKNGYSICAFIDNNGYKGEFSPYYHCINYHVSKWIPVIKKKIIQASYRKDELFTLARMNFNVKPDYYISLIVKNNRDLIIDFQKLVHDLPPHLKGVALLKYHAIRIAIKLFRPLYQLIKK